LLNFHFRLPTLKVIGESTAWALTVCLQTSLSAPLAPPVLSHGASLQVAWPSVPCPPSATDPKPPVLLSPQTGTSLAWVLPPLRPRSILVVDASGGNPKLATPGNILGRLWWAARLSVCV